MVPLWEEVLDAWAHKMEGAVVVVHIAAWALLETYAEELATCEGYCFAVS
jgi:hypothetical protein